MNAIKIRNWKEPAVVMLILAVDLFAYLLPAWDSLYMSEYWADMHLPVDPLPVAVRGTAFLLAVTGACFGLGYYWHRCNPQDEPFWLFIRGASLIFAVFAVVFGLVMYSVGLVPL